MRTILSMAAVAVMLGVPALAQDQTYKAGENGVKHPVLVREVKPQYTADAMQRQVQGVVEMAAVVKADGSVDDTIRVTRSLDPDLDEEAIKALRQWKFKPGTKDDQAVNVEVNVEMTFTLRKKGGL